MASKQFVIPKSERLELWQPGVDGKLVFPHKINLSLKKNMYFKAAYLIGFHSLSITIKFCIQIYTHFCTHRCMCVCVQASQKCIHTCYSLRIWRHVDGTTVNCLLPFNSDITGRGQMGGKGRRRREIHMLFDHL